MGFEAINNQYLCWEVWSSKEFWKGFRISLLEWQFQWEELHPSALASVTIYLLTPITRELIGIRDDLWLWSWVKKLIKQYNEQKVGKEIHASHLKRMLKPRQKAIFKQSKGKIDYLNVNSSINYSRITVLEIWTDKLASFLHVLALLNVTIGWCLRHPCSKHVFHNCGQCTKFAWSLVKPCYLWVKSQTFF